MQAITVKFIGPTNTRPICYKAECAAGSITVSQSHIDENQYHAAARALIIKLNWVDSGLWIEGTLKSGDTVFVFQGQNRKYEVLTFTGAKA